ncbi:dihydroxyacetone kinase subunit L [Hafnia alvei]|uniref:dihydroxyacetone kinase subunit L n=1 Tax=Hafnia alvei TaxID=569 RepID=UPI00345CDC10
MRLTTSQLKLLFAQWANIMSAQKETLIAMDSIVGDGDLGLTMSDGFSAAYHAVSRSDETDIGKFFYLAGKTMSSSVPSTMGTLMAAGLIEVGKIFKGKNRLNSEDFGVLFQAFYNGVQNRGKAQLGEKTFLDGLFPAVCVLNGKDAETQDWVSLAYQAYEETKQGVQNTTTLIAKHGRAATHGERSRSLLDPGAYVAQLLISGYCTFANDYLAQD